MSPLAVVLLAMVMCANFYLVVFPGDGSSHPLQNVPRTLGVWLLVTSAILTIVCSVLGVMYANRLSRWFIWSVANKEIARRPDGIVRPGSTSVFVDVIPRCNWHRSMWENAVDVGFLKLDTLRGEILFEGDNERYRIPADALRSVELEKSFFASGAEDNAPCVWLVVLHGQLKTGKWEAPICVRSGASILFGAKRRYEEALKLQKEIRELVSAR